jgi:cell division protein FtsQ
MDDRGRLAESVTEGAPAPRSSGTALARSILRDAVAALLRRPRARRRTPRIRIRLPRFVWRWSSIRVVSLPRGAGTIAATLLLAATVSYGVVRGGHATTVLAELADARDAVANTLGFRITSIALAGQRHITREEILTTAGVTGRTSLLFLDATTARTRLKTNPWIAEATVLKLYPGRLHIAVTEREAFALWQKAGKVTVISDDGTVVEPYVAKRFAKLPLVVGAGAEVKAKEFLALIDRYPLLRDQLHASTLVAERRWNLQLKNGITVRLPETDVERALVLLVQLDRDKKLLSRDVAAIDLRLSDRVTVRLSNEAAAAREDQLRPAKSKKKAGDA